MENQKVSFQRHLAAVMLLNSVFVKHKCFVYKDRVISVIGSLHMSTLSAVL